MSKNVNNDVSKESPIPIPNTRFIDTEVTLKKSILARNIGYFDPFRYCSRDRSLEYLKAVSVSKTTCFHLYMCCFTELEGSMTT